MKKIFTLVLLGLLSQFAIGQEVLINEKFSTNVFFPYRTENSWIKFTPRSIYELPCFWEYRPTAASPTFEFLPPDPPGIISAEMNAVINDYEEVLFTSLMTLTEGDRIAIGYQTILITVIFLTNGKKIPVMVG